MAHRPVLMLALLALFLFALSTIGYAGHVRLWSLPSSRLFENFRSSGRFVWPVTYFALFLAFAAVEKAAASWRVLTLVVGCVLLQWQDARYLSDGIYNAGHSKTRPALNDNPEILRPLVARHRAVYLAPDFDCANSKWINDVIQDFGWYAVNERKPVSTTYFARFPTDFSCDIKPETIRAKLDNGDLVIAFFEDGGDHGIPDLGLQCLKQDRISVCMASRRETFSPDTFKEMFALPGAGPATFNATAYSAPKADAPSVDTPAPEVDAPAKAETKSTSEALRPFLLSGWSDVEDWGVWGLGVRHVLRVPLPANQTGPAKIIFDVDAVVLGARKEQRVDILIQGDRIGSWDFSPSHKRGERELLVPENLVTKARKNGDDALSIEFHPEHWETPHELDGGNRDTRPLGLALHSFKFVTK